MLYWNRLIVICRPVATAVCLLYLVGCSAMQRVFMSNPTPQEQAMNLVSNTVDGSNLWSPIMFAGFLALVAGVVNLVFLRGSARLLIIGVLLALTPPVAEVVLQSMAPWISIFVAIAGLGLLSVVMGRWFGRKDILTRAEARANYIKSNGRLSLTKGQTADVLNHLGDNDFKADFPIKGN